MSRERYWVFDLWSCTILWVDQTATWTRVARTNKNKGYPVNFEFQINIELLLSISMSHVVFGTLAYVKICSLLIWNSNLSWVVFYLATLTRSRSVTPDPFHLDGEGKQWLFLLEFVSVHMGWIFHSWCFWNTWCFKRYPHTLSWTDKLILEKRR